MQFAPLSPTSNTFLPGRADAPRGRQSEILNPQSEMD
jgi:hypothetical protein